jgi:hypothetical protein
MKILIAIIAMICAGTAGPFIADADVNGPWVDHCNGFIRVEPWTAGQPLPTEVLQFQERCRQSNGAIHQGGNPVQQIVSFMCECPRYNEPSGACYNPNALMCSPPELLAPLNFNKSFISDDLSGDFQTTEQIVGFSQVMPLTTDFGELGLIWTVNAIERGKYKLTTSKRLKGSGILRARSGLAGLEADLVLSGRSCRFATNAPGHYYEGIHQLMIPVKKESLRSNDNTLREKEFTWFETMNVFQNHDIFISIDCSNSDAPVPLDVSLHLMVWKETFTSSVGDPKAEVNITSFGIEPSLDDPPDYMFKTKVFRLITLPTVGVVTP